MSRSRKRVGVIKTENKPKTKHQLKRISARANRRKHKHDLECYAQPSYMGKLAGETVSPYDICDFRIYYHRDFARDSNWLPRYHWFMK